MRALTSCLLAAALSVWLSPSAQAGDQVDWWLTSLEKTARLTQQSQLLAFAEGSNSSLPSIMVDPGQQYQGIDGFGFALTGGSAQHLMAMTAPARAAVLTELFSSQGMGIGISYLRTGRACAARTISVIARCNPRSGKT